MPRNSEQIMGGPYRAPRLLELFSTGEPSPASFLPHASLSVPAAAAHLMLGSLERAEAYVPAFWRLQDPR